MPVKQHFPRRSRDERRPLVGPSSSKHFRSEDGTPTGEPRPQSSAVLKQAELLGATAPAGGAIERPRSGRCPLAATQLLGGEQTEADQDGKNEELLHIRER